MKLSKKKRTPNSVIAYAAICICPVAICGCPGCVCGGTQAQATTSDQAYNANYTVLNRSAALK